MRSIVSPRRRGRRSTRRRGFVLLMVLVLIAIAAMILAGIARHSLGLALEASDARQSLQDRWATVSLERAVLGRVDKILTGHIAEKNLRGLALADRLSG